MDRLPHALPRARPSTNRTSLVHRRSRSRTIRPPGRLPGRVFFRFPPHHSTRHLRRCLCTLLAGGPARRSGLWIRHRASTARPQSIHGAPALYATPGRPLQLLPRPPSPNLEQITGDHSNLDEMFLTRLQVGRKVGSRPTPAAKRRHRKARHVSAGVTKWNKPESRQGRNRIANSPGGTAEFHSGLLERREKWEAQASQRLSRSALSATIYGVSLLTDTTGGSTLSIREHSNQTSLLIVEEARTGKTGATSKLR